MVQRKRGISVGSAGRASCRSSALLIADALAAGVPAATIAGCLGRPEDWVRRHTALVSPAARVLFATGRLRSVVAYGRLLRLPPQARRALLDAGGLITAARCAQACGTQRTASACPRVETVA